MSSRVFTHFDVINITEGYNSGPTAVGVSFSFVNANFGTFEFQGSGTVTNPPDVPTLSIVASYQKNGEIDFQGGVQPIPDDAIITRVRVRLPSILTASGGVASSLGGDFCQAAMDASTETVDGGPILQFSEGTGLEPSPVSEVWSESIVGSDADVIFDYSASPKTLTELIALHGFPILAFGLTAGASTVLANSDAHLSYDLGIFGWELEVTWTTTLQWTLPQPDDPVEEDTLITITAPDPTEVIPPDEAMDLGEITDIDIVFEDPLNPGTYITIPVLSWTWSALNPLFLTFVMPSFGAHTPYVVWVTITSTQFGGTVAKQLYTIFMVSASGIYTLIPGKTNDTLYIEDDPGNTIDVKIPNPFGKTGFL